MTSKKRLNWRSIATASGLIGIAAFLGLANADPGGLGWSLDVWASWVQAIGSVAAILAAVFIARWQHIEEARALKQRQDLEARSLGALLLRDMKRFRKNLEDGLRRVQQSPTTQGAPASRNIIPTPLWERVADMHKMGQPGGDLLRAIFFQHEARDLIDGAWVWEDDRNAFEANLEQALALCTRAIEGVRAFRE